MVIVGPIGLIYRPVFSPKHQKFQGRKSKAILQRSADLEMSSIGFHWMNRMVSESYYLLHCLAFFSYIPVRCAAAQVLSSRSSAHLLHRVNLISSLCVFWFNIIFRNFFIDLTVYCRRFKLSFPFVF